MQRDVDRDSPVPSFLPRPAANRDPECARSSPPKRLGPSTSPLKTPSRRRRSSIIHTTPSSTSPRVYKHAGADGGVERALDDLMKSLRIMAMGTPRQDIPSPQRQQSRWSLSSEESMAETEESGFWRPRKSGESTRSRATIGTIRSQKSSKSRKSRKSEDTYRMEVEEDIPPVPVTPATPGRRKRMMEGLAKRLGLTPRKKYDISHRLVPELTGRFTLPSPPPEREVPTTPKLPRKSSLSTLRSVMTRKSSTGTLRSVGTIKSPHPFVGSGPTLDCEAYPPVPARKEGYHGDGCLPSTPRRRTPKSSIGQPRLQPNTSPSVFLAELPRRAPGTPKERARDSPPVPDILDQLGYFAPLSPSDADWAPCPEEIPLHEKLRRAEEASRDSTPELSPHTRSFDTPTTDTSSLVATPMSVDTSNYSAVDTFNTPPLTARAAQDALKPKRLLNLLPKQSRVNLGLPTPPPTDLRKKKSTTTFRTPLGDRTNLPPHLQGVGTPQSIASVLANADRRFAAENDSPSVAKVGRTARRDPLGIISRFEEPKSSPESPQLPYNGGGGDGWGTPAVGAGAENRFESTFSKALQSAGRRSAVPDFTASPIHSLASSLSSNSHRRSDASMESDLPTEEWELEAYLKELERVDRERAIVG